MGRKSMKSKARRDDDEEDYHNLIKLELARLQRKYRLIENQRHGYTHESGTASSTQNKILGFLRAEEADLHADLNNANCTQYKKKAKEAEITILKILETFDKYQAIIKKQIKTIEEIEAEVDKISDRVVKQRLKVLSWYGLSLTESQMDKKLRTYEDRLYHVRTLFDQKCAENAQLRNCISNFLINRTRFHYRHNYLKQQLVLVKNKMLQVVLQATHTYDARDESVAKAKAIREREHKEMKQHVVEIKEFQRVLHHDHKIHDFISVKNIERSVLEEALARQHRKDKQKEEDIDQTLQKYRQSVKLILAYADFHSIDTLCSFYEDLEQKNFSKFKYTTDLNHDCEALKEAIDIIKSDIEAAHETMRQRNEFRRKQLGNLQNKVFKAQEELKTLEHARDGILGRLGKLVHEVAVAFDLAKCRKSSILRRLGMGEIVSQRNILLCINILDHEISNLKYEKALLEVRKTVEIEGQSFNTYKSGINQAPGQVFVKIPSQGGPYKADVIIPSHIGGSADEEGEADKELSAKPHYYAEMRAHVYNQMIDEGLIKGIESHVGIPASSNASEHSVKAKPRRIAKNRAYSSEHKEE